jgi:hypothetical protein
MLMNTSEFDKNIHDNDAKLKKGLKRYGWVIGHGWGRNIAPKMLHVSMGYVSMGQATWALKRMSSCLSKLDMF